MKHHFHIPCNTKYLKDARRFLNDVLNQYNLKDLDQNEIVLAVDEVCANVIIHSSNNDPQQTIELNVDHSDDKLIFEIIDSNGSSDFDINKYTGPAIDEIIKTRKKGGVGIMLVKKIMDKIEMTKSKGRNICRLYKNI